MTEEEELRLLRIFFKEVAYLTFNHDILSDHAVVYPSTLALILAKVKPEWWKE